MSETKNCPKCGAAYSHGCDDRTFQCGSSIHYLRPTILTCEGVTCLRRQLEDLRQRLNAALLVNATSARERNGFESDNESYKRQLAAKTDELARTNQLLSEYMNKRMAPGHVKKLERDITAKDARIAELEADDRRWYSEETMAAVVKERDAANKRIAELEKAGKAALTVLSGNSMTKGELIEALTLLRAALAPTAPGVEPDWAKG